MAVSRTNTIQILHSPTDESASPANAAAGGLTLAKGEFAWQDQGVGGGDGKLWIGDATAAGATERHIGGCGDGAVAGDANNLTGTTIATGVVTSSLTTVGALGAGSISSGFGNIDNGSSTLDTGAVSCSSISVEEGNITNAGDINCDSISIDAAATGLNIDFSGANTGLSALTIKDNVAEALVIQEGTNDYMQIVTTTGSDAVKIGHGVSGTAITLGHATSETTVADNLTVTGNLTVIGDTSETKVDNLIVDNATIAMGTTDGAAPASDVAFDVGIKPHYHTGSAAKTGFLGIDVSTHATAPKLTYIPDASFSSDVVSGTAGTIVADLEGDVTGNADTVTNATLTTALTVNTGTLTLTANSANNSVLTIGAGAVALSGSNTGDQDTVNMGDGFTVSATTDTTAITIVEGEDLMLTAGSGMTVETTGTQAVTFTNTAHGKYVTNDAADIMAVSDFGAVAALKIDADQPATAAAEDSKGLWIDYDRTVAGSGTALHNDIGLDLDVNTASLGNGSVAIGMDVDVVGATSGTHTSVGLTLDVSGSDVNQGIYTKVTDGGPDLKMVSSADTADYATLEVGASGATTLTTVDSDAGIAHLNLTIDGGLVISALTGMDLTSAGVITNATLAGGTF